MSIALIVAVAKNGVIGRDNQLPWRLPKDLQYFKKTTMGKVLLMGRKTFESIGSPLPGRISIVLTRDPHWRYQGEGNEKVHCVSALQEALALAQSLSVESGQEEVMVIGGAEIYREALPYAERLYFTEVNAKVEGDAYFPDWQRTDWQENFREYWESDARNPYPYSFIILDRVKP